MRRFRLGTLRPDGTVEPASPLAAEILAAVVAGDDDRQRGLLTLAARLDEDNAHTTRDRGFYAPEGEAFRQRRKERTKWKVTDCCG